MLYILNSITIMYTTLEARLSLLVVFGTTEQMPTLWPKNMTVCTKSTYWWLRHEASCLLLRLQCIPMLSQVSIVEITPQWHTTWK